jgi:hypothetical protein
MGFQVFHCTQSKKWVLGEVKKCGTVILDYPCEDQSSLYAEHYLGEMNLKLSASWVNTLTGNVL